MTMSTRKFIRYAVMAEYCCLLGLVVAGLFGRLFWDLWTRGPFIIGILAFGLVLVMAVGTGMGANLRSWLERTFPG